MFNEDNNGFILFPHPNNKNIISLSGKSLVYLIAFDTKDQSGLSCLNLKMSGLFVSDDMVSRPDIGQSEIIDSLVDNQCQNDEYDKIYFPNINSEDELKRLRSINLISSICIGWSNYTFEFKGSNKFWNASFRDLTNEGRKTYYSIKKLHNNKEVRIITFNNI